jgi:hypothetical protein
MGKPVSSSTPPVASTVTPCAAKAPTVKDPPAVALIDGNADFNNLHFTTLLLSVPLAVQQLFVNAVGLPGLMTGVFGYAILLVLLGIPVTISYWTYQSRYGKRHNDKIPMPKGNVDKFIEIKDEKLRKKYHGRNKIPMVVFQDAWIAGKVDFKG